MSLEMDWTTLRNQPNNYDGNKFEEYFMTVIKRDRKASSEDLVKAIGEFVVLLRTQKEDEAIVDLNRAAALIGASEPDSDDFSKGISIVLDAFNGDHELIAYTLAKLTNDWTIADQLAMASTRVLNLAKRMRN